jgi:hypothetical protein
MNGRRLDVRLALAWGVVTGVVTLLTMPVLQPGQVALASDAYYHAAHAFLAGDNPYLAESVPTGVAPFVYPPAVLLAFLPHALAGSPTGAYALQTAINVLTLAALAVLVLRVVDREGVETARVDRALLVAFVAVSPHATTVLVMGQVNLQLALAIGVGVLALERGRAGLAGAAVALAAAVKLFPAVVGAWFLRLRRGRAVLAAVATGLASFAVGAVLVDRATITTYLTEVVPGQTHTEAFAGGLPPDAMYVTVRRPIAALLPDVDPTLYAPLGLLVLVPFVLASYRVVGTRDGRRTALLATLLATIVALPLEAFYFSLLYVPLLPLLVALEPGRPRRLLAGGTALLSTAVSYHGVSVTLDSLALSGPVGSLLRTLAGTLTVVQPPLVGAFLVLAGCALYHHRAREHDVPAEPADLPAADG